MCVCAFLCSPTSIWLVCFGTVVNLVRSWRARTCWSITTSPAAGWLCEEIIETFPRLFFTTKWKWEIFHNNNCSVNNGVTSSVNFCDLINKPLFKETRRADESKAHGALCPNQFSHRNWLHRVKTSYRLIVVWWFTEWNLSHLALSPFFDRCLFAINRFTFW